MMKGQKRASPEKSGIGMCQTRAYPEAQLKNDLPGLMGFGVTSLKNMRKFYEAWCELEDNSASTIAEFDWIHSRRVPVCPLHSTYPDY